MQIVKETPSDLSFTRCLTLSNNFLSRPNPLFVSRTTRVIDSFTAKPVKKVQTLGKAKHLPFFKDDLCSKGDLIL